MMDHPQWMGTGVPGQNTVIVVEHAVWEYNTVQENATTQGRVICWSIVDVRIIFFVKQDCLFKSLFSLVHDPDQNKTSLPMTRAQKVLRN